MKKYCRNIVFSKTPLRTHLRFNDEFQIYPIDFKNAPQSDRIDNVPLILEFWIDTEEKVEISPEFDSIKGLMNSISVEVRKRDRIIQFLSVATNHHFFGQSYHGLTWGVPFPDDLEKKEEVNSQASKPIIPAYVYPELSEDLKIEGFVDQRHPDSELIKHGHYYMNDPVENNSGTINFPHTIFHSLDAYYKLDEKTKKKIDTICHLIANGLELEKRMKSLSFLSFVSAIETLVSLESKNQKSDVELKCRKCQSIKSSPVQCEDCGRPLWGIGVKFREFLKKYVANSDDSIEKYKRIYGLRSRIVHNGSLFLGDEAFDWSQSDKSDSEWITYLETKQLARLAVVNWVNMNKPAEK